MIVTCERCHARYKLDDSRIKGRGARITCPRCRHVFTILTQTAPEGAAQPAAPPAPEPPPREPSPPVPARPVEAPARSADHLDFRKVGIPTWKVKVKIGLVYDFSDTRTLRKYIQDRRVTDDDVISWDGLRWTRIGDIEDLDAYFVRIYEERESPARPGGTFDAAEDAPTMIVSMAALGSNSPSGVFDREDFDALTAPLKPLERPAPPGSDTPPRFVDPFEALRRSHPRHGGRGTRPDRRRVASGGPARATTRRIVVLASLVAVAVFAAVWLVVTRHGPAPVARPAPVATAPIVDQREFRAQMIDRIEQTLEAREPLPIEPEDEEEPLELRPVVPTGAATRAVRESRESSPPKGATITQAPAGAADHASAADSLAVAGDWAGAAEAWARAVSMEPGNARYRGRHGEALYRAGRPDEARVALEAASSAGFAAAHKYLGHIARDQGDAAGAVSHYQQYLKSNPPDRPAIEQEVRELSGG